MRPFVPAATGEFPSTSRAPKSLLPPASSSLIDLYNTLLEKNAPDMIRVATLLAAMQRSRTED